jgi:hypothetical protein
MVETTNGANLIHDLGYLHAEAVARTIPTEELSTDHVAPDSVGEHPTTPQADAHIVVAGQVPLTVRPGTNRTVAANRIMGASDGDARAGEVGDLKPLDSVPMGHNVQASRPGPRHTVAVEDHAGIAGVKGQATLVDLR